MITVMSCQPIIYRVELLLVLKIEPFEWRLLRPITNRLLGRI